MPLWASVVIRLRQISGGGEPAGFCKRPANVAEIQQPMTATSLHWDCQSLQTVLSCISHEGASDGLAHDLFHELVSGTAFVATEKVGLVEKNHIYNATKKNGNIAASNLE
jgi:hypothetical protein